MNRAHRVIRAGRHLIPVVRCDSCTAEIVWATTVNSKKMPVNASPTSVGTQILRVVNGVLVVRTLRPDEQPAEGERRWTAHHAVCPAAAKHRRDAPAQQDAAPTPLTALPVRTAWDRRDAPAQQDATPAPMAAPHVWSTRKGVR